MPKYVNKNGMYILDEKEEVKEKVKSEASKKFKNKDINKLSQNEKDELLIALCKIHELI